MNKDLQEHHDRRKHYLTQLSNNCALEYDEGEDPITQGMVKELDQVQSSLDRVNMIREIAQNPDPRD